MRSSAYFYFTHSFVSTSEAQFNLAVCYYQGYGVTVDLREGVKWFIRAAEGGNINAQLNIGLFLYASKRAALASIFGEM